MDILNGYAALERGISSKVIRSAKDQLEQRQRSEYILQRLKEADRVLEILRPISPVPRTLDQATIEKWMKLIAEIRVSVGQRDMLDIRTTDPRDYFAVRFPEHIHRYGPLFFGSQEFMDGRRVFIPEAINDLAFAAILGGDHHLGQQVVWYAQEQTFYYRDFRVGAFCPTTDAKMVLLASNWLIGCSEGCHPISAKSVLKLRTPKLMDGVITTAKAILMADAQFFSGKDGRRRYVDGHFIEANDEPSYQQFVNRAIVREPEAKLTVVVAFHRYYQFCKNNAMTPLTRSEFKNLVAEVIREQYGLGIRHDVPDERGKQGHGWMGLRLDGASTFGMN